MPTVATLKANIKFGQIIYSQHAIASLENIYKYVGAVSSIDR